MTSFVLVHSPSVGPATWAAVAGRLRESGHGVAVPSALADAAICRVPRDNKIKELA